MPLVFSISKVAGAIKELESLSDDLGQYEAKKEALRKKGEIYQKRVGEAASKIAGSEEMIKMIEREIPPSYNWAERVPTERSEDEIKADKARIEKKIKAAEVCSPRLYRLHVHGLRTVP